MAISLPQGFKILSKDPIDNRLTLTKAEMLAYPKAQMPDKYICICKDDGKLYIYDKNATVSTETGAFKPYEEVIDLPGAIQKGMSSEAGKAAMEEAVSSTLPGAIAKTLADETKGEELVEAMFDNEQFSLSVDSKVQFQVDKAIQCIEAIDGMA